MSFVLWIEFTFLIHITEVLHQSKPVPGSPFKSESFDPARIIVHGVTRGQHAVHSPISFVGN